MANPSVMAELQTLETWRTKMEVASMAQEGMFDRHFVYKNIFKLEDEEIEAIQEGKQRDRMTDANLETVTSALLPQEAPMEEPMVAADAGVTAQEPSGQPASPEAGLPPPPGEEGRATGSSRS